MGRCLRPDLFEHLHRPLVAADVEHRCLTHGYDLLRLSRRMPMPARASRPCGVS
jgi:hypothetical protein